MEYAIQLKNVTKTFGKVVANKNVNLDVKKGEILSLLGENGSGKTTLMNMISGIYFPDSGEIMIDGRKVEIRSPKDAYDLGIGMIHQHSYELYAEGIRDCGDEQKGVRLSLEKVVFELPLVPQSNIKINSDNVEINGLNILVYKGKNSYVYMPEDEE